MNMRSIGICLSLLVACGDDGSTAETEATEGSGSTAAMSTTDGGSTPTTMDTSAGSASATGGSSTGPTPGDSSSGGPMPTSTGDTGPADSSGGSEDSTGGNADNPYPACMLNADPECPKPAVCSAPMGGDYTWCGIECDNAEMCPVPGEGTAIPFCGGPNDLCMLDCSGDATCPTGMDCIGLGMGGQAMRCAWPTGA